MKWMFATVKSALIKKLDDIYSHSNAILHFVTC